MLNAMKIAVGDWNKKGGVLGEQIAIDAQDSPCNPQVAVQAAQKIVSDGDIAVVGPYCSSDAIPASTIYHRANIPFMVPASTNPKLTAQGFHNIFRTIGRDDRQGKVAAQFIVKWHAKRVAIVHDNSTYGKGVAELTRSSLATLGPNVRIVYFDAITPGAHDFSATLTKIRDLKPDVTFFTGYYPEGGLFCKQWDSLGVSGRFLADDANNDPTFIKLAGKAAEKAYITGNPLPQYIPSAAAFVKAYKAAYHMGPGAYSATTVDATNILLNAIKKAGTTDGSKVIPIIAMTKNYAGITGSITFDATGDRANPPYVLSTVRNGQFVPANV
jgi:ABC-type branched-subunit amino acid transport system substrate-binding protein